MPNPLPLRSREQKRRSRADTPFPAKRRKACDPAGGRHRFQDMEAAALRRKQLGAFYTPAEMAEKLVAWAVREPADRVLDPSFGGLVFLQAAEARLRALGAKRLPEQLLGAD